MKKIDAHAHIGNFGGWAGVESTPEVLVGLMDEFEVEMVYFEKEKKPPLAYIKKK